MKHRNTARVPAERHKALEAIWGVGPGWGRLAAVNHTIVGRRFILTAFFFFAVGGLLAMLMRAQLATPRSAFLAPEVYNQIFTMHGTVMMFLFVMPMLEGIAMYLLPKMLGARDLAFPRLSAYGYWCFLFGGIILLLSLPFGVAPDSGWFMYTPLSSRPYSSGMNADVWLIGVTLVEISAICAAVEFAVSILKVRAPGMSLNRLPIFAWYMLVTAIMMLIAFPPLILASILLEVERAFGWPFFDPTRGGSPLLWQHLFWIFGHPEVYIIFLPAAGIVSVILPVLARHRLVGYDWIVVSIIALGVISFGLWVHHMFTVGIPRLALIFFSAASLLVVIPTAIQIFSWIATLIAGRPQLRLPMLFILGFFLTFIMGGLTGVMVTIVPFNWQAHDTYFVVAHFHYVLIGSFIFPMLAAAYYWLPHLTGRMPICRLGTTAFWLIFIGLNLTFLVMHLTGLLGMPRRIDIYAPQSGWEWPNLVSSIGGFVMAGGFALFVLDIFLQLRYGRVCEQNPWQATTLEWATPTPPPSYAFASLPHVHSRDPLEDDAELPAKLAAGQGYLADVRHGWPETLGVHVLTGDVDQIVKLPRPTHLPLYTAIATSLVFCAVLFGAYEIAVLGAGVVLILALLWPRAMVMKLDHGALPIGGGAAAPLHTECASPPSWWAMIFVLLADAALFASLVFGSLYLPVTAPNWPPAHEINGSVALALASALFLALAAIGSRRALQMILADEATTRRERWLVGTVLAQVIAGVLLALQLNAIETAGEHAYSAVVAALFVYSVLHAAIGVVFAGHGWYRYRYGYVSQRRLMDLRLSAMWQGYTASIGIISLGVVHVLPVAVF